MDFAKNISPECLADIFKINDKYGEKYSKIKNRFLAHLTIVLVGVAILLMCNTAHAKKLWSDISSIVNTEEHSTSEPEEDSLEDTSRDTGETTDNNKSSAKDPKPYSFNFVLKNPNTGFELEDKSTSAIISEILFENALESSPKSFEDCVSETVATLSSYQYESLALGNLKDSVGNTYYTYTEAEDEFLNKIRLSKNEPLLSDWKTTAPTSDELDYFMNGRTKLLIQAERNSFGCWELCWKLANDHQRYALEYQIQTQNHTAVFYHYIMSIHYTLSALSYNLPEDTRTEIYHYLTMRYHDIAEMPVPVGLSYKRSAEDIYECLVKKDILYESNMNKNTEGEIDK